MDVSVIMINYNTFDLTKDALESIFTHTKELRYEIILIDNASPDGSGERLRDLFGDKIVYLQSGANLGTSKAFNLGLKQSKGKYILWLNTDILIKENFIKKLYDYMESDPNCGVCGGNVLDFNGKPSGAFRRDFLTVKTFRRLYSIAWNLLRLIPHRRNDYNYTDNVQEVAWVGGVDMFVRRDVFLQVGGFDEIIFMYAEELEFQYRVKKLTSYTIKSVPQAVIYHLGGASTEGKVKRFNPKWERMMLMGFPRYLYKWFGEEEVKKYLKVRYKGAKKQYFLAKICNNKIKMERYQGQQKIFLECLSEFRKYIGLLNSGLSDDQSDRMAETSWLGDGV